MAFCPHTEIAVPECSCRACLQALLDQHRPGSEQTEATETEFESHRRRRFANRLRQLRTRRAA